MKRKVIIIGGPTGVGKSELAFRLAESSKANSFPVTAFKFTKELEIGANKTAVGTPGQEHLLDLVDWTEEFTAADFYDHCTKKMEEILGRNEFRFLLVVRDFI